MLHRIDIEQLKFIHQTLRYIMHTIERWFGPQDITSLFRIGDPGVHGTLPLRGIDLRYKKRISEELVKFVNEKWFYDPARPARQCAMIHDVGQGIHVHLQVHPHTIRRHDATTDKATT